MTIDAIETVNRYVRFNPPPWRREELACANPVCFNAFTPRRKGQKFCSYECGRVARRGQIFVELSEAERETAERYKEELQSQRLSVVLIPSGDADMAARGGKIRAVEEANPEWYQRFCSLYTKVGRRRRRERTYIQRKATLRGLERLLEGDVTNTYALRLYEFIQAQLSAEEGL